MGWNFSWWCLQAPACWGPSGSPQVAESVWAPYRRDRHNWRSRPRPHSRFRHLSCRWQPTPRSPIRASSGRRRQRSQASDGLQRGWQSQGWIWIERRLQSPSAAVRNLGNWRGDREPEREREDAWLVYWALGHAAASSASDLSRTGPRRPRYCPSNFQLMARWITCNVHVLKKILEMQKHYFYVFLFKS